jgi:hypothetical protein
MGGLNISELIMLGVGMLIFVIIVSVSIATNLITSAIQTLTNAIKKTNTEPK